MSTVCSVPVCSVINLSLIKLQIDKVELVCDRRARVYRFLEFVSLHLDAGVIVISLTSYTGLSLSCRIVRMASVLSLHLLAMVTGLRHL